MHIRNPACHRPLIRRGVALRSKQAVAVPVQSPSEQVDRSQRSLAGFRLANREITDGFSKVFEISLFFTNRLKQLDSKRQVKTPKAEIPSFGQQLATCRG